MSLGLHVHQQSGSIPQQDGCSHMKSRTVLHALTVSWQSLGHVSVVSPQVQTPSGQWSSHGQSSQGGSSCLQSLEHVTAVSWQLHEPSLQYLRAGSGTMFQQSLLHVTQSSPEQLVAAPWPHAPSPHQQDPFPQSAGHVMLVSVQLHTPSPQTSPGHVQSRGQVIHVSIQSQTLFPQ